MCRFGCGLGRGRRERGCVQIVAQLAAVRQQTLYTEVSFGTIKLSLSNVIVIDSCFTFAIQSKQRTSSVFAQDALQSTWKAMVLKGHVSSR